MTVVQTSIPDELYKKLVEVSKSEKRSIKEIVMEAIEDCGFGTRGWLRTVLELEACGFRCEDKR